MENVSKSDLALMVRYVKDYDNDGYSSREAVLFAMEDVVGTDNVSNELGTMVVNAI